MSTTHNGTTLSLTAEELALLKLALGTLASQLDGRSPLAQDIYALVHKLDAANPTKPNPLA